jgi:hypothetical protein
MSAFDNGPEIEAANPARGDVEVELDGHRLVLRPTPGATAEIEHQAGRGTLALINAALDRTITLHELAIVVCAGVRATGEKRATVATCQEMVWRTGIIPSVEAVQTFLIRSVNGGRDFRPLPIGPEPESWMPSRSGNGSASPSSTSDGPPPTSGDPAGTSSTPQSIDSSSEPANNPPLPGAPDIPARAHKLVAPQ